MHALPCPGARGALRLLAGGLLIIATLVTGPPPAAADAGDRTECASFGPGPKRDVCMHRLRQEVSRERVAAEEQALLDELASGKRAGGWAASTERMSQGVVTELSQRQEEIAAAGGFVTAGIAAEVLKNDDVKAGVVDLAENISESLTADVVELTRDVMPIIREEAVASIEDVLTLMMRQDMITDAASAATTFSLQLAEDLGPALSGALAESLTEDLGPAMAEVVRDDLGPALNDILANELFPALFSEMNKALLSSSEEIARRASRGAVVGVIEGFDDQEVLDRFDDYVDDLRRETLQDLTDSYDEALEGTVAGIEDSMDRTSRRLTWLAALLMVLGALAVGLVVMFGRRAAIDFRTELSELRILEEKARRTTELAVEAAERETALAQAAARETEGALELVTEAIKHHEDLDEVKKLVDYIRKNEGTRHDTGGDALERFLDARPRLKVVS